MNEPIFSSDMERFAGSMRIDLKHSENCFEVFTIPTQQFYGNSLSELTPERFLTEEQKQIESTKWMTEAFGESWNP